MWASHLCFIKSEIPQGAHVHNGSLCTYQDKIGVSQLRPPCLCTYAKSVFNTKKRCSYTKRPNFLAPVTQGKTTTIEALRQVQVYIRSRATLVLMCLSFRPQLPLPSAHSLTTPDLPITLPLPPSTGVDVRVSPDPNTTCYANTYL